MAFSPSFFTSAGNTFFSDATAIDQFFIRSGGQDFISWFNAHVGGRQNWGKAGSRAALMIANDSLAHDRFSRLWSNESIQAVFGAPRVSLLAFAALQSIIINETGGRLLPVTEITGNAGHPGIAYAFDKIPGIKKSYNTLTGNKTCLQLFSDADYNRAFSMLPLADRLKNTADAVWGGEVYPQQHIAASTNPAQTGYVLEADFFKFRGRGFIQTTGRSNYMKLINFVMSYTGQHTVINHLKAQWSSLSNNADVLASMSSNANWDDLFQKSDGLIACKAIQVHNEHSGQYLQRLNAANINTVQDTVYNMGLCISGAKNYAALFQSRVIQLLGALTA